MGRKVVFWNIFAWIVRIMKHNIYTCRGYSTKSRVGSVLESIFIVVLFWQVMTTRRINFERNWGCLWYQMTFFFVSAFAFLYRLEWNHNIRFNFGFLNCYLRYPQTTTYEPLVLHIHKWWQYLELTSLRWQHWPPFLLSYLHTLFKGKR